MPFKKAPKIIAFLCNWCSYEAADAAGRARLPVYENLRVVRVPCSGRVAPEFVMEAFVSGADGVLVLGCPLGDCHYRNGNYHALVRASFLKPVLAQFGIETKRFRIDWASARDAEYFVRVVNELVMAIV